MNQERKPIEL